MQPEDPCNIQFTSGTTGYPKGSTLSHHNILNNANYIGETLHYTEEDRLVIPVPLYHCMGNVLGSLAGLCYGAATIFPSEGFDPVETVKALHNEKGTSVEGVPTMFHAMLEVAEANPGKYNFENLRTGIMAGSLCPEELLL